MSLPTRGRAWGRAPGAARREGLLRGGWAWLVLGLWSAAALTGPLLPLDPDRVALEHVLQGPGAEAWLGWDALGRPVLDRLVVGARISFLVAALVVSLSLVLGTAIGMVSAWVGGALDHVVVRVMDVFLAFPGLLLAIALAGLLGPGVDNVVIALVTVGWVGFARLARAQTLALRERPHVLAAIALGCGPRRILIRHILPLLAAPLSVEATFAVAAVVIGEAGLSFLGLGVQPPQPSWGTLILEGSRYLLVAPHLIAAPAVAVGGVVLAANLAGDRIRDWLDVRAA